MLFEAATGEPRALYVCAHGAGGHMRDRAMEAIAPALRDLGLDLVRFDFPYRGRGSRFPDPMPVLERAFAEVVEQARRERRPRRVILGGRSLGGRVATMLAARGFPCDALLLFAYPLHPDGKPEKRRDAHLPAIRVPLMCVNGTQDRLCRRDLMERVVQTVNAPWRMHWVEGAGHSFHEVPQEQIREWLDAL